MKSLILGLMVLVASSQASAKSIELLVSSQLAGFKFQPNTDLANRGIQSGNILVTGNYLSLELLPKFSCPAGVSCAEVMPAPVIFEVPLLNIYTDGCGATIYTGFVDKRPVDGMFESITVTDNSTNKCKYLVAIPRVQVDLQMKYPFGSEEAHVLTSTPSTAILQ